MDTYKEKKEAWNGLIRIKDMKTSYSYGSDFFVDDVLFEPGKITSVIGKNGCGKTTVLKTIAGLMPYSGSILIDEKECRSYKRKERAKKVSYLPQIIKPVSMDVRTLVEHGRFPWHGSNMRLSETDREFVDLAIETAGLSEYEKRELSELSGGELRRAYLSMIIAQNARMMILDEPTAYMDIENILLFEKIIKKLTIKGIGIIMSSHNIEQSFSISDKIVIMDDRKIKAAGSPKELLEDNRILKDIFGVSLRRSEGADTMYSYIPVLDKS